MSTLKSKDRVNPQNLLTDPPLNNLKMERRTDTDPDKPDATEAWEYVYGPINDALLRFMSF